MRDAPDVDNLLSSARESLLANVLPAIAEAQKREVLMIANALAIARRTLAAGEAPLAAEYCALRRVYGLPSAEAPQGSALTAALEELNGRVARDIRNGAFDAPGPARESVAQLLLEQVRQKLRENRPKLLEAEGRS